MMSSGEQESRARAYAVWEEYWSNGGEVDNLTQDMKRKINQVEPCDPIDNLCHHMKRQRFYTSDYIRPRINKKRKRTDPGAPPGFERQFGIKKK